MKTTIDKSRGYYRLLLTDPQINSAHKAHEPILLGCISNYFDSQNWTVSDLRLSEHMLPSPYLCNSVEEFIAKDEEEFKNITSQLSHYNVGENPLSLSWNTYNTIVLDGADRVDEAVSLNFPRFACFSFSKGMEKLTEMKEYWENVHEPIITSEHLIHNPNRQLSSSHFFFQRTMAKLQANKM